MNQEFGPKLEFSRQLFRDKYAQTGETFEQSMGRIASALSENDTEKFKFFDALLYQRFLPAGRIQTGAGTKKNVTLYSCFVSGDIEDDFVGPEGIMQRATEAAQTMRMGGGVGYNFSSLRPRGDKIRSLDSQASGPVSFMEIYDAVCRTVASSGHRRGAQMGVLRVDHPDILEFIKAKQNTHKLTGFNISVGITDEFMAAVNNDSAFDLKFNNKVYSQVNARELYDSIMHSTWDYAEPGVLFLDRINEYNNLWYCENITSTNPCSEQPLPANGACLLGSFNLTKYLAKDPENGNKDVFSYSKFLGDIGVIVRCMDRVVDISAYPLQAQKDEAQSKRRMGLGITGFANASEILGWPYGSKESLRFLKRILAMLTKACYTNSALIAKELGSFPMFDKEKFLAGKFVATLDKSVRGLINAYGLRNSHLVSIAPTGTISLVADNVSSGIEPTFSYGVKRTIQTFDGPSVEFVSDYAFREYGVCGNQAEDVSARDHLNVAVIAQRFVDSAVSKTCNIGPKVTYDEFKSLYMDAWLGGCKGLSTFRANGKRQGVLENANGEVKDDEQSYCTIDEHGQKSCA